MKIRILLSAALFVSGTALADVITLTDGSRINGEVVSMKNGQYQIETGSLGLISLTKQQIQSISSNDEGGSASASASAPAPTGISASQVGAISSRLASDPGIMQMIMQLQTDPDMQAVLSDPELMQAVQRFDLEALRNNPKMQRLMENRRIQAIQGKVE